MLGGKLRLKLVYLSSTILRVLCSASISLPLHCLQLPRSHPKGSFSWISILSKFKTREHINTFKYIDYVLTLFDSHWIIRLIEFECQVLPYFSLKSRPWTCDVTTTDLSYNSKVNRPSPLRSTSPPATSPGFFLWFTARSHHGDAAAR